MDIMAHAGGRPSDYTQNLADTICEQLANGDSLRTVCESDDMPNKATVFRWMRTIPEFRDQYVKAKEEATDALADEIMSIADEETTDVQRSRLRVDTRKWIMAKMKPKKYGDSIDLTTKGEALPTPIYGGMSAIQGHPSNKEDIQPAQEN